MKTLSNKITGGLRQQRNSALGTAAERAGKIGLVAVKFTPGPWTADDAKTPAGRPVIAKEIVAGIRHIADVRLYEDADSANARLIAASPELLAALESLLDCPDLCLQNLEPGTIKACEAARAAIAKAKVGM